MNNQYITDSILAQQEGSSNGRLSAAELKEIKEREHHLAVAVADRQRQLEAVMSMQEWYKQNEKASHQLEDATNHHSRVNKQYLALRSEEMKLNLFDSVQELRPFYEQIVERRRVIEGIKIQESQVAQAIEQKQRNLEDFERKRDVAKERLSSAEESLAQHQSVIENGYVLDGEMKTLAKELIAANDILNESQQLLGQSEADLHSRQNEMSQVKQIVENLNLHRQTLAVHQQLFEQFQAVNDKLQLYNSESKFNERIHQQFTTNNRRQAELVIIHDRTKKELQTKHDRLDAVRADRKVHETAIDEIDSALLYRNYSQNQLRMVQLQSARVCWQTLVDGYNAIDVQRASLERMVRQLDQKRQEQEVAERDVKRLYERYSRLNKAYILLQIENTRKLREGLKEGTACPVCGSAHHPYHTEVEQELGETQTQLEKDYHVAKKEFEHQQEVAAEVIAEAQMRAGHLEAERAMLERMKEQQKVLEEDWTRFEKLDASFAMCSSSVNRDARRTTIEMLIDGTDRHLKDYEQRIKKYDFHAAQLHDINLQIRDLEREVEEMEVKFWQLDAELKVVNERLDIFRQMVSESDTRLEHLYKDLDDVVTLSGWRDDNLDNFSKSISELNSDWMVTNTNLDNREHQLEVLVLKSSYAEASCNRLRQLVEANREECDRLRELLNGKRERLRKDFGNLTPTEFAAQLNQQVDEADQISYETSKAYNIVCQELSALLGQKEMLAETRQQQEECLRETSLQMDHAIARYNLTHAAIQTSELNTIFTDTRDWMLLRQTVEECHDALIIANEQMMQAQQNFMQLQNASERPSDNDDNDKPEALRHRHTDLILELDSLRGEQADIRRILHRHESSL